MSDNTIIQQLVAENSATFRKKVAEHSVTTEIERINSSKEKLGKRSKNLRLSLTMSDKPICDVCGGEGQIHDADFSEGDSDQQMHLMQDTLRSCPKCSSTPNTQQLSEEQTIKAKIALAKTIPVIAVGDVDPLHMAAEIMLKVISDVTSSNARFLSVQSLIEDSPDLAKVMLSKLFDSYKAKLGRAQTTQKGQLAIVGPTQKFFPDYQLAEMTTWIIDQLTLGSAKVEIWEATKSPFRDDLTKVRMIKTY